MLPVGRCLPGQQVLNQQVNGLPRTSSARWVCLPSPRTCSQAKAIPNDFARSARLALCSSTVPAHSSTVTRKRSGMSASTCEKTKTHTEMLTRRITGYATEQGHFGCLALPRPVFSCFGPCLIRACSCAQTVGVLCSCSSTHRGATLTTRRHKGPHSLCSPRSHAHIGLVSTACVSSQRN